MSTLLQRIAKDISETLAGPFGGVVESDDERYVARAADVSDVERRMRELEREPARAI
jgi:hypothetical protein